ncbi:hypothetical protein E2C01_018016 [Portunus trituberculatus]|uniref:Uncharacterized protein n=1 Tax=Portunus trituberculatus TaxID=210409 RepID=A0A5B7DTF1_PORTR|nr:hypothetical protein [Portunus trituberculatus]
MKEALLAAYGLSAEKLKEQFFSASMSSNETASQFASRLAVYLRDWQEKDGAENTVKGIKDLLLQTQFVKSCPEDLVARLKIDKVGKLKEMSEVAWRMPISRHMKAIGVSLSKTGPYSPTPRLKGIVRGTKAIIIDLGRGMLLHIKPPKAQGTNITGVQVLRLWALRIEKAPFRVRICAKLGLTPYD